jgi:hypothetical protein
VEGIVAGKPKPGIVAVVDGAVLSVEVKPVLLLNGF